MRRQNWDRLEDQSSPTWISVRKLWTGPVICLQIYERHAILNNQWSAFFKLLLPCTLVPFIQRLWPLGRQHRKTRHPINQHQPTSNSTKNAPNKQTGNKLLVDHPKRITAQFGPQGTSTGSCSLPEISVDTSMVEAWRLVVKTKTQRRNKTVWTNKLVFGRSWCSVLSFLSENHSESERHSVQLNKKSL